MFETFSAFLIAIAFIFVLSFIAISVVADIYGESSSRIKNMILLVTKKFLRKDKTIVYIKGDKLAFTPLEIFVVESKELMAYANNTQMKNPMIVWVLSTPFSLYEWRSEDGEHWYNRYGVTRNFNLLDMLDEHIETQRKQAELEAQRHEEELQLQEARIRTAKKAETLFSKR